MKGEARCSIKEDSLVQREVSAQRADGGIDGIVNNRVQCSSLCLPDTIPQSKIRDFCQPPLHKGAFTQLADRTYAFDALREEQRAMPVK